MRRCYIDPEAWSGSEVALPASVEHHLVDVLRVSQGEMVEIFDGKGRRASARVATGGVRGILLKVEEITTFSRPCSTISLIQAIPKGSRMDYIIEKATELGVGCIYPVVSERTVVRINDDAKRESRKERWQRIGVSAAEQSGVCFVPEVKEVRTFEAAVSKIRDLDVSIVGSLGADARPLRDVMGEARKSKPATVGILIGPEGDLTPLELKMAVDAGALPVSFGKNVLRVETAALFAVSIVFYELAG